MLADIPLWLRDIGYYGIRIIAVLAFVIGAYLLSGWVGNLVRKKLEEMLDAILAGFLGSLCRWGLLVMAVIACLGFFGFEMTSFAVVIGAAGLAIGLAMQGTLSNLSAGVMLMIFRPFKAGDVIVSNGHLGKVVEITLFTTNLDTFDNRRIILPNGAVFTSSLENITFHPTRRVDIPVGIDYGADIAATRTALEKAAAAVSPKLADPPPQIILLNLNDSSVDWQVRVWTNTADYWDTFQATIDAVKAALGDANITIPFPQMDVHMDKSD